MTATGALMADYRAYQLDESGHIYRPPETFACESDEAAIQKAETIVDGHDIELWQLDRLVIRLSPKSELALGGVIAFEIVRAGDSMQIDQRPGLDAMLGGSERCLFVRGAVGGGPSA